MSEISRRINAFFSVATRQEVVDILKEIILTDRQAEIFELFYIKHKSTVAIADREIKDKLQSTEDFFRRYEETKKPMYHRLAMEELHQGEMMIKEAGEKMSPAEYQEHMKCMEDWYISLHHKLNGVK